MSAIDWLTTAPSPCATNRSKRVLLSSSLMQGLTLVNFPAQLEPCLTQENSHHSPNTPLHSLNTGCTTLTRAPYPMQSAQVELRSGRV
jgi:hypothetical protein